MPQVVQEYVNDKNFANVDAIKRDILTLYRADIIKHTNPRQHYCNFNYITVFVHSFYD